MAEEKKDEQVTAPRALPVKLIMTGIFVLLNLAVSGGGAALVYMSTLGFERHPITEEEESEKIDMAKSRDEYLPILYTMEPFTINMSGKPNRTMRTVISFEMLDERGFEEIVRLGAQPKDQIVRLLGSKTFHDVESVQGKLLLKDQIVAIVNKQLKEGVIKDIYFNEFVVQ